MSWGILVLYPGPVDDVRDRQIWTAAGRESDYSGTTKVGDQERSHRWECKTEVEALRIFRELRKLTLRPKIISPDFIDKAGP